MFRALRQSRVMSQAALARSAGICASHLCQIERGSRRPSLTVLARLCEALQATSAERAEVMAHLTTGEACHGSPAGDDSARGAP
jgi:transcriptional regulator with XRE-family HTH domain